MQLFIKSAKIFTLVLLGSVLAVGQQTPPVPAPQSGPKQTQPPVSAPVTGASTPAGPNLSANTALAQPALLTPVNGNLIVAPGFTMNFDWSAKHSGEEFRNTFDAARRSGSATRAWIEERSLVADNQSLSSVPSVVITGEVQVDAAPAGAIPLLTH